MVVVVVVPTSFAMLRYCEDDFVRVDWMEGWIDEDNRGLALVLALVLMLALVPTTIDVYDYQPLHQPPSLPLPFLPPSTSEKWALTLAILLPYLLCSHWRYPPLPPSHSPREYCHLMQWMTHDDSSVAINDA